MATSKLLGDFDTEELDGKAGIRQLMNDRHWQWGRKLSALLELGLRAARRCFPGLAQSPLPLNQEQKPCLGFQLPAAPAGLGKEPVSPVVRDPNAGRRDLPCHDSSIPHHRRGGLDHFLPPLLPSPRCLRCQGSHPVLRVLWCRCGLV